MICSQCGDEIPLFTVPLCTPCARRFVSAFDALPPKRNADQENELETEQVAA